jgi:hypothetical protein
MANSYIFVATAANVRPRRRKMSKTIVLRTNTANAWREQREQRSLGAKFRFTLCNGDRSANINSAVYMQSDGDTLTCSLDESQWRRVRSTLVGLSRNMNNEDVITYSNVETTVGDFIYDHVSYMPEHPYWRVTIYWRRK